MQLNSLLGTIKADFQTEFFASLLQSHNPSEILLTILFSTKKHLLLLLLHNNIHNNFLIKHNIN